MSEQVIGRVTLNNPDAFNELFNALRKLAGKNNYLCIEANELLSFTVGNPSELFSEITLQPNGAQSGPKHSTFDVVNFKVELPFKAEITSHSETLLKKLSKFKPYDRVSFELVQIDSVLNKKRLRLIVNNFIEDFPAENNELFNSPTEYLAESRNRKAVEEPKKFSLLNKKLDGTIDGTLAFGKELVFLAKNYTESIGRMITQNIFIGKNENTDGKMIVCASNGFAAYMNTLSVLSNDENFYVQIQRKNAEMLGSVLNNKKLFSGKAIADLCEAFESRASHPVKSNFGLRNFEVTCEIFNMEKVPLDQEEEFVPKLLRFNKLAFFQFTANETMAHFTVMIKQPDVKDGCLDALVGVFKPTFDSKNIDCAPSINIEEFITSSERVAKGSDVTLKNIKDTIMCEAAVLVKGDPLGSFIVNNGNEIYPAEDIELCLNTEFLRTVCKAQELNGATHIHLFTKNFIGEKDGVVLITGDDQSESYVALMPIRK